VGQLIPQAEVAESRGQPTPKMVIKQQILMLKTSIEVVRAQNDTFKTVNITDTSFNRKR